MNRVVRSLAFPAACGALAGLVIAASPADAAPDIPAAAARAASHGWPHTPTVREARQVARFAHRTVAPTGAHRSGTYCRQARWDASAWSCRTTVVFTRDGLTGERFPSPRVYRFRTTVQVWEDGSARVHYPTR